MSKNAFKLSIVILNYNTADLLKQTIESIKTPLTHQIIVVDNHSTDNSVAIMQQHFPSIKLIETEKNLGFAAANNLGLRQATGEYVMLLNSDTLVQPGALETLCAFLDKNSYVSAVTPKLTLESGSLDPASHRGLPTLWNAFCYFSGLEKIFSGTKLFGGYHQTWKDLETNHQIDACSMAAMVFRKDLLTQIGFLDEDFFMYAEDIDYCKRIQENNGQLWFISEAEIIHLKGKSGTHSSDKQLQKNTRKHFYQTMKQYFRKHYTGVYPDWVLRLIDVSIDIVARVRQ